MNIQNCWYKRICQEKCSENCIRYKMIYSLFRQSQLPEALWEYKDLVAKPEGDVNAFIQLKNISNKIDMLVEQGKNIDIYSNNAGNGKTTWAIRWRYAYFDKIWHKSCLDCKAVFVSVPKFL